eukprot:gene9404-9484_t
MNWYENNVEELPYYHKGTSTESADAVHFTVPQFSFVNQDSIPLTNSFIRGKVWIINYFFTSCPTICPKMMAGMRLVQQAFPNDGQVRMVSLTVDPWHDTPAKLKRYAKNKNMNLNQWQLGTGQKADLYRFARNGLFITADDGDGGTNDFIHSDKIVLIDRENHIRGYYDAIGTGYAAGPDSLAGKALFQKNCTSCHAVQTRVIGPALRNVSSQTVIKSGDTSATNLFAQFNQTVMPDHPDMSDQDIKNIISYIRSESKNVLAKLPATAAVEDNDPYKGESGFVRQVVYVDLPGEHTPILPGDYRTWFVMGGLIFISLLTLYTVVKAKTIIVFLNKKYGK